MPSTPSGSTHSDTRMAVTWPSVWRWKHLTRSQQSPIAASLPTPDASSCPQLGTTSRVMLVNGTADPINPYQGGVITIFGFASRGTVMSSEASAQTFAKRNGIAASPVAARMPRGRPNDPTSVESLTWLSDGRPVSRLYTVHGGGHVIPQQAFRFRRLLGRTTTALNAPNEAVRFFEAC